MTTSTPAIPRYFLGHESPLSTLTGSNYRETHYGKELRTPPRTTTMMSEGDPDSLIKEYFHSLPKQRAKIRKIIAKHVVSPKSIFAILMFGLDGNIFDSYDAAIDLLAECRDMSLLVSTSNLVVSIINNNPRDSYLDPLNNMLEILIKGIAFAYHINSQQRFNAIISIISAAKSRIIKATIIDALVALADEVDTEAVKEKIKYFTSNSEVDAYIRKYATEALEDFSWQSQVAV